MGKVIFFSADDGVHGEELWITDGTAEGTRMVRDILPPENTPWPDDPNFIGSDPGYFAALPDGRVVFQARDELFRRDELWVSDGTSAGTFMVANIGGEDDNGIPRYMTPLGDGRIVFSASDGRDFDEGETGEELWITDGTEAGTRLLKDIQPGRDPQYPESWEVAAESDPRQFYALQNGKVIFTADDGVNGRALWVTDGTEAGTTMLLDFPADGSYEVIDELGDGTVKIETSYYQSGIVKEIWMTDGTPGGTQAYVPEPELVGPVPPAPFERGPDEGAYPDFNSVTHYALSENQSIFASRGFEKFDFDDLPDLEISTFPTPNVWPSPKIGFSTSELSRISIILENAQDEFFYNITADSGDVSYLSISSSLYAEGTGPVTISTVAPGLYVEISETWADVTTTFIGADGTTSQQENKIWTNGWVTPSQETLSAIGPGLVTVGSVTAQQGVNAVDVTYNVTDQVTAIIDTGTEIWTTDGTESGTTLLQDINPGVMNGSPNSFSALPDGRFVFAANDGISDSLWVTDGTKAGTKKLVEGIEDFDDRSAALGIPDTAGLILINSNQSFSSTKESDFWVTDGTLGGTVKIIPDADYRDVFELPDGRWLVKVKTTDGDAVWITDLTPEGTLFLTKDLLFYNIRGEVTFFDESTLIFQYFDSELGIEPFKLDLEGNGFGVLLDMNPAGSSHAAGFTIAQPAPVPISTLFDEKVSMEQTPASFDLDDYFTDPEDSALSYTVSGTPDEITVDGDENVMAATQEVQPGTYTVEVTARNNSGGKATDSFDWTVVDTGLF
ncbi:MAG TPA: putative Ig domain-containing protein, partial [Tichowtungia sp.]|nr:putative Ig domain-containing protein [Tichowtungia sp.]